MVIRVQKDDFLSLNNKEQSVNKLQILGQIVQVVQGHQLMSPCVRVTNGKEDTMVVDDWHELFNHQHQERERNQGQRQVVRLENEVQLPCSPVVLGEQVLTTKDQGVVGKDRYGDRWES